MSELDDAERLDQAIDRLDHILRRLESRQSRLERRLASLYQSAFVAFTVLVASISFLVIIFVRQVPTMTAAIDEMNTRFASVADDMVRMDRNVLTMNGHLSSLPEIIRNVDRVHHSVGEMSGDVSNLGDAFADIDQGVAGMNLSVGDMRGSFVIMEHSVGVMGRDVDHMSQPMRLFNQMNPFR